MHHTAVRSSLDHRIRLLLVLSSNSDSTAHRARIITEKTGLSAATAVALQDLVPALSRALVQRCRCILDSHLVLLEVSAGGY
jgi:hypothetical protein